MATSGFTTFDDRHDDDDDDDDDVDQDNQDHGHQDHHVQHHNQDHDHSELSAGTQSALLLSLAADDIFLHNV